MSLADLPDVLIAHLCSYLDYSDVCNLMETSKKNYNAIKAYMKDKIQCRSFRFTDNRNTIHCTARCDINDDNFQYDKQKSYTFNERKRGSDKAVNIAKILKECSNVVDMDFYGMVVNENILKMLNNIDVKIGSISIIRGDVNSGPKEFITFCQKYGICNFKHTDFNDKLWTDDVFVKVVPYVMFDHLSESWTYQRKLQMTNRTLMTVLEHANSFDIPDVITSFTIEGIVKGLEIYPRGEKNGLFANIGILSATQLEAANRYFNKETGELKDIYDIDMDDELGLHHYAVSSKNLSLRFCVKKY